MNNIFDSHAHYNDRRFDDDRDSVLQNLPLQGVKTVLNCGTTIVSSEDCLQLAEDYDYLYAACGVHPHEAEQEEEKLDALYVLLKHEKCLAVGEIGLDYHYDFSPRDTQQRVFERQIQIANELHLPVIVHDRESHEDTMRLLKQYKPAGVVHCFSGSAQMAKEVVKLGMYVGFGGALTFKGAKKPLEAAAVVPKDKLLLETDCPYMAPVPHRGKRCDSSMIPLAAEVIATIWNCTVQEVLDITNENAQRLFFN
ncbi:MAG: TatD family deoxyribonuclease [Ruminococcaceae bacterium]|nr:TatD family deoxyribonuclease [Oscillospiraceae bacterium]